VARAFEGIRVIDFSQVLAGPFATQHLALLGADVIKIESPGTGESGRHIRSADDPSPPNMSSVFLSVNAGKRSLSIDLKHASAKEVIHRLVRGADVIVQNYKAGVIDRLGFGYEAMSKINPGLVYCSVSGYGQNGPRAHAAAYDPAVQSASGMMQMVGTAHSGPLRTGYPLVDMTTGLNAAIAICGALYRRQVTGEGQFLDVAMLDSAMSLLSTSYMMYMRTGVEPQLLGNQSQLKIPTADVFPTGEGHIQITALTEEQNRALCEALSLTELLDDERFATFDSRVENREAMCAHLTKAFATRTAVEWETLLGDHKVPASAVLTFPQALAQPQLKHRDFLMQPPAPQGFDEPITFFNAAYESPSDGPGTDLPPPGVGQHTDDVLDEFGFTPEEILALRNGGALGT
jgi:crotonobetainyl-CoA:carnitine CoA-transferase CaiB-like acyl-CoA transferase